MRKLPDGLSWVYPYVRHPWAVTAHLRPTTLDITLCGRVKPGRLVGPQLPDRYCPRCLARLEKTYPD